jgi:hypothetical protein
MSEQGELPEALSFAEQVENDVLDPKLDTPFPNHEQDVRWLCVSAQNRYAFGKVGLFDLVCDAMKLVVGESGERWVASEEARDLDGRSMSVSPGLGEPTR